MRKFEDVLGQCIDDIKAGRAGIEDCLTRYPSLRERLKPLLGIALGIRELPEVEPSATFKAETRVWLMDQIQGRRAVAKRPRSGYDGQAKPMSYVRRFSTVGVVFAILLALVAAGGGTVYAAQDSLPGDALYAAKLATEQVVMVWSGDDVARAERALSFAERRMREMEALVEKGRSQDLELAVEKYGNALNMALAGMRRAYNQELAAGNIATRVAEATTAHLGMLDMLYDMVPHEARSAVGRAREVSERGRQDALAALARNNPVRATEMNLAAMLGSLNRSRARLQDGQALQIALQQFVSMARFGQDISLIGEQAGLNMTEIAQVVTVATSMHVEVLLGLYDEVSGEAREAVQQAMEQSFRGYETIVTILMSSGVGESDIPVISEETRHQMEDILGWTDAPKAGMPSGQFPGGSCPGCGRR